MRSNANVSLKVCVYEFTLDPDADVFQASLLQQSFRHVSVLDELEETVELGAVDDLRNKKANVKSSVRPEKSFRHHFLVPNP